MTVSELIVLLQARRFRGDMRIVTGGFDELNMSDVTTVEVIRVKLGEDDGDHIADTETFWDGTQHRKPYESELTEVVEINF